MVDNGRLRNILIVTTGSKATDLHRGSERLPGRKGKLDRSSYLFTPLPYREFKRVCGEQLGEKTLLSYLLSGGSPVTCSELAEHGRIPEYVIELVRDWVDGEIARSGRSRSSLWNVMHGIQNLGSSIGQSKLAREAGLAIQSPKVMQNFSTTWVVSFQPIHGISTRKFEKAKRMQISLHKSISRIGLLFRQYPQCR